MPASYSARRSGRPPIPGRPAPPAESPPGRHPAGPARRRDRRPARGAPASSAAADRLRRRRQGRVSRGCRAAWPRRRAGRRQRAATPPAPGRLRPPGRSPGVGPARRAGSPRARRSPARPGRAGGERLRRLRPGRLDQHLVALLDAEGRDAVQAPRADRARRRGDVLGGQRGVELARGLHEPRGRAGVQAEPVGHRDAQLERGLIRAGGGRGQAGRAGRGRLAVGTARQVGDLARQPAARFGRHLVQRIAEPGRDGGGDRSLHQGGLAQQHPGPPLVRQHLRRHLGGQHRAAQIHEHEHPVVGPGLARWPAR